MTSRQYLRITVSQRGIDALVALFAPDGKKISEADSEHIFRGIRDNVGDRRGGRRISDRGAFSGENSQAGRYEIEVEELRAATAEDKYRGAGEIVFEKRSG